MKAKIIAALGFSAFLAAGAFALGSQRDSGNASCTATSTSSALDQLVQRQLKGAVQG